MFEKTRPTLSSAILFGFVRDKKASLCTAASDLQQDMYLEATPCDPNATCSCTLTSLPSIPFPDFHHFVVADIHSPRIYTTRLQYNKEYKSDNINTIVVHR